MTTTLSESAPSPGSKPMPLNGVAAGQARVLILDDEPSIRTVLGRFLERHGCAAMEAASVAEVERLTANGERFDGLILDVRLPGRKSGIDLLEQLRRQPGLATTPVIVLTGGQLREDEQTAITKYGAHLFYKPEGFPTLVGFLKQLMGRDQPD